MSEASERKLLIELRRILTTRFSDGELRTLCFDLGIDYAALPGEGKADKARELVAYFERRDRILELIDIGKRVRPDISWNDLPEDTLEPRPEQSRRDRDAAQTVLFKVPSLLAVSVFLMAMAVLAATAFYIITNIDGAEPPHTPTTALVSGTRTIEKPSPTATPSASPTPSRTPTVSPILIPSPTHTPLPTLTPTMTSTPTSHPTNTPSPTLTPAPTLENYIGIDSILPEPGTVLVPDESSLRLTIRYSLSAPDANAAIVVDTVLFQAPDCSYGGPWDVQPNLSDHDGGIRTDQSSGTLSVDKAITSSTIGRGPDDVKSVSVLLRLYREDFVASWVVEDKEFTNRCYPLP
jgi:hypothetical protein